MPVGASFDVIFRWIANLLVSLMIFFYEVGNFALPYVSVPEICALVTIPLFMVGVVVIFVLKFLLSVTIPEIHNFKRKLKSILIIFAAIFRTPHFLPFCMVGLNVRAFYKFLPLHYLS